MLHDRQGSIGLFGPFAYTIAAADAAANAYTTPREAETAARKTSTVESLVGGLREFAASIARPQHARTA